MTVGERIKQKREEMGLSQGDLATKMNVSRQAISKAELHDSNLTTDKVVKFAKVLGVSEAYLMGWTSTEETKAVEQGADDAKLLYKYHQLTPANQQVINSTLDALLQAQEK